MSRTTGAAARSRAGTLLPKPHTRSTDSPAQAPLCLLACVDEENVRRHCFKKRDGTWSTICKTCEKRIDNQAKKGRVWRKRRYLILTSWVGGLDYQGEAG